MLKVRRRYVASFALCFLLCACSGAKTTIPQADIPTIQPAPDSRTVRLGPQATTFTLPLTAEISGTLVFPPISSPATVSIIASADAPAGVELDRQRRPLSGTLTVYEYVTMIPATTISLPSIPAMTFSFPATTPLAGKSMFYGISDLDSQGGKISFDTQGPGTINGQIVSFPLIDTPLTLQAGHSYTFVLYGTSPKPTGATKIYVTTQYGNENPSGTVTTFNADGSQSTPTITGLNFANAIAVNAKGTISIDDYNDVRMYSADGVSSNPVISVPFPITGIAVDQYGALFVTQYQAGVAGPGPAAVSLLTIYSATGSNEAYITAGLSDPQGVAVTPNGKIYVTNTPYFSSFGPGYITTYTRQGTQTTPTITGSLKSPGAIAIDGGGKLYVGDGNSIKTFLADGTPTTPTITRAIRSPVGIAVDAAGKIYVANAGSANITTYEPDGTQTSPTIATDRNGRLTGVAVH